MTEALKDESFEQLVVFKLGDENYAIDISLVHEIILMENITRIPKTPVFLKGVINLRGQIIPVIDLKTRFDLEKKTEITPDTRIIIVEEHAFTVGIIVDEVTEVMNIPKSKIERLPESAVGLEKKYFHSVGNFEGMLIMLLDIKNVLAYASHHEIA